MTPLYDYNISVVIGNYLIKAIANDKDLNINKKKDGLLKRLRNKKIKKMQEPSSLLCKIMKN